MDYHLLKNLAGDNASRFPLLGPNHLQNLTPNAKF